MDIGSVPGEIGILPEYREVTGTPRELYGPKWALVEKRRGSPRWAARPSPPLVRIGQGEGAGPPLSFPPSANPIPTRIGGGDPTPRGSRTPHGAPLLGRPHPPLSLSIWRQGHPRETQVDPRDHILSRVRCPLPP